MRELTQAELDDRHLHISGGSATETVIVVIGHMPNFSSTWFNGWFSDYVDNQSTFESIPDIPTNPEGEYTVEDFVDDIANLSAEDRANLISAIGNLGTTIDGFLELVELDPNVSLTPQALSQLTNLANGLGLLGDALAAGNLANEFANGNFTTGNVAAALNLVTQIAVGSAVGGPLGFISVVALELFGEEAYEFVLEAAVEAGAVTAQAVEDLIIQLEEEIDAAGLNMNDWEFWERLLGIPSTPVPFSE